MWRNRAPQPHRLNPGFPGVDHLIARYEATSGRSVRDIDVYRVMAAFKLAIIVEGNLARIRAARPDEDHSQSTALVGELATLALEVADASSVPTLNARTT
jgi:aminoglycoside phosphotransferase (APT) family kinase protein